MEAMVHEAAVARATMERYNGMREHQHEMAIMFSGPMTDACERYCRAIDRRKPHLIKR